MAGGLRTGKCIEKTTERALYRRNVDFDTVDEYKDANIFNRGFKPATKVWVPTNPTKKGHNSTLGPLPEHMSPHVVEKPKKGPNPVWK